MGFGIVISNGIYKEKERKKEGKEYKDANKGFLLPTKIAHSAIFCLFLCSVL